MTHPPGPEEPSDEPSGQPSDEAPTTPYQHGSPSGHPHQGGPQGPSGRPQGGYVQPGYPQPGYGSYPQGYQLPGYHYPGYDPAAPYGVHPLSGIPYSEKSKIVAGLLQVLLPLGIGRMYMGHTGMGVAQLLVTILTCGVGALWPFVDGIVILVSDTRDAEGRMLRS